MNKPTVAPNPINTARSTAAVKAQAPQAEAAGLAAPLVHALLFIAFIGYYLDPVM